MKAKTLIGISVASALSWSYGAMAGGGAYGHMGADSTYGVVTPFSPGEAGPAVLPHGDRYAASGDARFDSAGANLDREVITPLASNEAGPNDFAWQREDRSFRTASASRSMANPQTPWSPSEAGMNQYGEDLRAHEMQVAEVERAHLAAAEWNASIASADRSGVIVESREGTSGMIVEGRGGTSGMSIESRGGTSGMVREGRTEGGFHTPERQSALPDSQPPADLRSEAADVPPQADHTAALQQESEYALPTAHYSAVGVLEAPSAPSDYMVWNVEPLTPGADLSAGDTIYVMPEGYEIVIAPGFGDSSPLGATGEQAAGVFDGSSESADSASLL